MSDPGARLLFHFVDVYADDVNRRIIMYFHSMGPGDGVATSKNGLNFNMPGAGGQEGHGIKNVRVAGWYLRGFEVEGEANGKKVSARFSAGKGGFWRAPLFNTAGQPNSHANADTLGGWFRPDWDGDPTPESLRVTAPHAAHPIVTGNIYPIGWWSHGGIAKVDLEYSVNGKDWISIEKDVENSHRYLWAVPDRPSDCAVVRVRETGGEIIAESEPFTITAEKAIGIVFPRKGDVYTAGATHYPAYCSVGNMEFITFEYSVDGGEWVKITDKHPNKSALRAQWNAPALAWKVPAINSDNVRLRVSETGGTASVTSETFSVVAMPE